MPPTTVTVPDDVRAAFPDLVELILHSESMNDEERQYWISVLPAITPEQVQSLRDILENEKRQLAAIDQKYAQEIDRIGQGELVKQTGEKRRERRESRTAKEEEHRHREAVATEDILKEIEEQS